ncbi:putative ABC transporter permease subunit [Arabiibacter massiliensis]|uniref:putative ABC transporter permease subunit n=1 Tax=Arabiibacter massiliensis TaxID=1870985 RepID=UPI0009B951AB|nr:hypothetical protein [Arabiibacter massiliensis]
MKSFVLLVKIQLLGLFGINKALHANADKARRTLALVAVGAAGIVALVALYVTSVAGALVRLGLADAIPAVAVLVGAVAGGVAAFLKANGMLFAFKDYDLVMSLPVPTAVVVLSRIASLYAMSLAFGLLVMVPAFCVYAANVGVTAVGVAFMALSVVLAPLAPLAVAVALAALIAAFSSRFRHANIVMVVLMLAATLAVIAGALLLSGQGQMDDLDALAQMGAAKSDLLVQAYPPAAWAAEGVAHGDALAFCLFAVVNVAAALVLVFVLTRLFVPVNALLMSTRSHATFSFDAAGKGARAGVRTPFRALVAKELRLLLATPVYLLNGCMGYVLVVVGAAAEAVALATGALSLDAIPAELAPMVGAMLPWTVAFCVGISSTTAPSVSLEGSARWLMQTAPVPARTVLGAKAAVNLLFAVPTVLVGGALLALANPLDAPAVAALFAVPLAFALFSTFLGLALDARWPRYDWTTVYEPVKRGMPVFAVVFGGMVLAGVGMAASLFGGPLAAFAVAAVVAAASLLLWRETLRKGYAS